MEEIYEFEASSENIDNLKRLQKKLKEKGISSKIWCPTHRDDIVEFDIILEEE